MVNKADTVLAFIECTFYCRDKCSKWVSSKSISSTDKCFADIKLENGVESNEIGLPQGRGGGGCWRNQKKARGKQHKIREVGGKFWSFIR